MLARFTPDFTTLPILIVADVADLSKIKIVKWVQLANHRKAIPWVSLFLLLSGNFNQTAADCFPINGNTFSLIATEDGRKDQGQVAYSYDAKHHGQEVRLENGELC